MEIVNMKMRQVSITISEFSNHFVKFILKNVKSCSPSMQAVEITL